MEEQSCSYKKDLYFNISETAAYQISLWHTESAETQVFKRIIRVLQESHVHQMLTKYTIMKRGGA